MFLDVICLQSILLYKNIVPVVRKSIPRVVIGKRFMNEFESQTEKPAKFVRNRKQKSKLFV